MEKLETTGSTWKIVKPNAIESERIIMAQAKKPHRQITCVFDAGRGDEITITRSPYLHLVNGMEDEIMTMFDEMIRADHILIQDVSLRINES